MTKKLPIAILALFMQVASNAQTTNTITLQPDAVAGKDAEIFSCVSCGYSVRNFGTKRDFNAVAWTKNGSQSNIRSLIEFNLSSIPANATITDARLNLYFNPTSEEGKHVQIWGSNKSYLQRITSSWSESTVTWNTQPTTTTLNQVSLPATTTSTQSMLNINVKQLIIDSRNNPSSSFGFMLKLQHEKSFKKLIFASSDNPDASIRPKLVITYTTPSPIQPGSGDEFSIESINIYPNPIVDEALLQIEAIGAQRSSIEVVDVNGTIQTRLDFDLLEGYNQVKVNTSQLKRGIYFVRIGTNKKVLVKKLIKQ